MKKVIIDCDTGVDDAQAILLALSANVEIIAITCVTGNVFVDQAALNTVRVLHAADSCHIPVYKGCTKPLLDVPLLETAHKDATKYHGDDGLGDAPEATVGQPPYSSVIKEEKAAAAICRLVNEYQGEVTLIALGPVTNVALAMRLDASVGSKLKALYIMGGAIYAKGNVTVVGEFNTASDPEAAAIVLEEASCPTFLMPWETCCQGGLDWEWHDKWASHDSKIMKFLKSITTHTCKMDQKVWETLFCPPDLVTMALAIDNNISVKQQLCHCYVDCGHNPLTRGQLIVDWKGLLGKKANITVCLEWDYQLFRQLLDKMLKK